MAKVFRLHSGGDDTIIDWGNSAVYSDGVLNKIVDPEGGTARKEITSIPSPFARIDLVMNAFKEVNRSGKLDGGSIYHKTVSDTLDVGEIFFNFERYRDMFEIILWDRENGVKRLEDSETSSHNVLGSTLEMYLKQDRSAYNFDRMKRIFLLNYIGPDKPNEMNIVGATSPSTLFFSSANDLSYVTKNVAFGDDRPFDKNYNPLFKRDIEYLKYLWALSKSDTKFSSDFPEVFAYLQATYQALPDVKKNVLSRVDELSVDSYDQLTVDSGDNSVEILGYPLHKRIAVIHVASEFEIVSPIYEGRKPLVLPAPFTPNEQTSTYEELQYTQAKWGRDYKAPYKDDNALEDRILPHVNEKYPYLSISDFLGESIIETPYNLNSACFFDGNPIKQVENKSYLLPLTNLFFKFFTLNDLMGKVPGGKKMVELTSLPGGGVTVTLRIPIIGNGKVKVVEFVRQYNVGVVSDLDANKGCITVVRMGLGLFPLMKFAENQNAHYRIALLDKCEDEDVKLIYFDGSEKVDSIAVVERLKKSIDNGVESHVLNKRFDRIVVSVGKTKGVILPIMKESLGQSQFTFAVDFGTTNTHIEYKKDDEKVSHPFEISKEEVQFQKLHVDYHKDKPDFEPAFVNNFVPETIGSNSIVSFPMRTAFAEDIYTNFGSATYTLANGNIAFQFEKGATPPNNHIKTNLKWAKDSREQIRLFVENILFLLRNKVLLNGGGLDKTKVVWFYPASMPYTQWEKFNNIWVDAYKKYFGNDSKNVISMSESSAPYHYYALQKGASSRTVTIDIGGGTTDVYVVEEEKSKMLISFKFASNAIFGDGYNWTSENNGFVKTFSDDMLEALETNELITLSTVYKQIEAQKNSSDINSFFFSLAQDEKLNQKVIPSLNYLQKLSDSSELTYVFILFYSAIIYFVANSMKAKGFNMPLTVAFSGNGSKTLRVLSTNNATISKFAKMIIEKVFEKEYSRECDLQIICEGNPKVATCKGGLNSREQQDPDQIDSIKHALLGTDTTTLISKKQSMAELDDQILADVVKQVERFLDIMFELDDDNGGFFAKRFGANASISNMVKESAKKNLLEYAKKGVEARVADLKAWESPLKVEETLFFYPIVGMLNNLAREIANRQKD